jgi:hypothetical protein
VTRENLKIVPTTTATINIINAMAALDGRFLSKTHSIHDMTYHHSVDKTKTPTFLPVQPPPRDMGILALIPNHPCSPAPYGHVRSPYVRSVFVQRWIIHSYRLATLFV